MTSPAAAPAIDRAELTALVAWAIRFAMAWAEQTRLPEDEMVTEAVDAIAGAVRTYEGKTTLSDHVRRRVRGELLDAAKKQRLRHGREVLLDDLEEDALGRALGVEALLVGSPEDSLLRRQRQAALDREVAGFTPVEKRIYALRHREGLPWDEIQKRTGIPKRTLGLHDQRIREHLTAVLSDADEES